MAAGRDDWLESMRGRMAEQRDQLSERPPFPVWGISSPALTPYAIESTERDSGGWRAVTVRYGARPPAGPTILVRSAMYNRAPADPMSVIQAHWPAEPAAATAADTTIVVRSDPMAVTVVRRGRAWATTVRAPLGVMLTVAGADVVVESVWLVPIDDLSAYRDRAAQPWLEGLDPHRALIEALLAGRPRRRLRQLRAVQAQRRITGGSRGRATAAVQSMLDQVIALREGCDWFTDRELRAAAVEEILRYGAYRADVASAPAQLAWARDDRGEWERAWSRWVLTR